MRTFLKLLFAAIGLILGAWVWLDLANLVAPHVSEGPFGGILTLALPMFPAVLVYLIAFGVLTRVFFGKIELR